MRRRFPDDVNELVAEHVFWRNQPLVDRHNAGHTWHIWNDECWYCLPEYETGDKCEWRCIDFNGDMAHAWKIVEEMRKRGFPVFELATRAKNSWQASFSKLAQTEGQMPAAAYMANADKASKAICLASLLAVGLLNTGYEVVDEAGS